MKIESESRNLNIHFVAESLSANDVSWRIRQSRWARSESRRAIRHPRARYESRGGNVIGIVHGWKSIFN